MQNPLALSTYDYLLPEELIAQYPVEPADTCKFLVYDKYSSPYQGEEYILDTTFDTLPSLLDPQKHVLFFNESKVLKARIPLKNAISKTKLGSTREFDGEIFYLKPYDHYHGEFISESHQDKKDPETSSGGQNTFIAMVYPGDRFPIGGTINFEGVHLSVKAVTYEGRLLELSGDITLMQFLEKYGQLPLPPYVEYTPEKESVYQPVFARKEGSVASPTASLHFTQRLLDELTEKGTSQEKVVLHVGLGTFKNIYEENIQNFDMHIETIEIPQEIFEKIATHKQRGKTILAIGTTVARTLESLPYLWEKIRERFEWSSECQDFWNSITSLRGTCDEAIQNDFLPGHTALGENRDPHTSVISGDSLRMTHGDYCGCTDIIPSFSIDGDTLSFESRIFIYPDFQFKIIDELITNFHLPKSTLLMLVSAFVGIDDTKKIYTHAIAKKYRFFSFGDAMYLRKNR